MEEKRVKGKARQERYKRSKLIHDFLITFPTFKTVNEIKSV